MVKNYFKVALRNLSRNKGFTILNIAGLTLGLATCLLIAFYIADEVGYDRYNMHADRIVRVNTDTKFSTDPTFFAISAPVVAGAMQNSFPEVETTVRLFAVNGFSLQKGAAMVSETRVALADSTLFDVFTLPMIAGNPATALIAPHSIVISESTAKKYFGGVSALGKNLLKVNDDHSTTPLTVTGVIKDMPSQSHFHFDIFLPMSSLGARIRLGKNFFALFNFNTYLLLKPGADPRQLEAKLPGWLRQMLSGPRYGYDAMEKAGNYYRLSLTPLTDIHLRSNRSNELGTNGSLQYVYIFLAIALFILVIACINFMNLSTARSADRAREVGVRKVLGSSRRSLIFQFLSESLLITLASVVLAILTAGALLPFFNRLSGKELTFTLSTFAWLLPTALLVAFVVGALAGSYPAFFLSAFQPVDTLKGKLSKGFRGGGFRNGLVIFQFSISIFLIAATLIIYNQLGYIQNKDLGFDRHQVLIIKHTDMLPDQHLLKQEVERLNGVEGATLSGFLPTGGDRWHNFGSVPGNENSLQTEFWPVDEEYISTMGMQLVQGRNFSRVMGTDSSAIILNETAARMLGYAKDPIGKSVTYAWRGGRPNYIIGVIKDFNFASLRDNITPLALVMSDYGSSALSIRINTDHLSTVLAGIGDAWKKLSPNQAFDYSFMDRDFDALYRDEQHMAQLFISLTALAIGIACLGLFGLAAYAAEQRTREIGIRKVLGAGIPQILSLMSRDFLRLVLVAILIATPGAWWAMNKWLQGFAYRDSVHAWAFLAAGTAALLIAAITVSTQALKAARVNPVESLRGE